MRRYHLFAFLVLCPILLFSQGSEVLAQDINADNTEIDIRQLPAGIYLLKVAINENSTTLKITKR